MATEKKVIFSATDNVSQKAAQIYQGLVSSARKQTDSLKEQSKLIDQQIKALEKKLTLEAQSGVAAAAKGMFSAANKEAPGLDQARARVSAREALKSAEGKFGETAKIVEILQNLLNEQKKTSSGSEKAEKEQAKKLRVSEDQWQSMRSLARQEVREGPQGVRAKVIAAEKTGYADMDPRQAEKLMYQRSLLPQEKKEQGVFAQVFAGVLAAGIVQSVARAMGQIVGASSGEQAVNSLLGSIPVVGGLLSGGGERHRQEQFEVERKELELSARTGGNIKALRGKENIGFSAKETLSFIEPLITAAGNRGGAGQAGSAMLLSRGLGLSQESITQIVKDIRTTRTTSDVTQIAADIIRANPELRKDQTKFAEILAQTSQLTNTLATQTENTDLKANAGIVGALRGIGGSFENPATAATRMMSINQALTTPGTEYQKARSFGVLSGINPGASYFQTLEAQEKGIGQKGYLSATLRQLKRETGGGEQFMLAAKENLNLPASTSRKLVAAFDRNPKMFDNFTGGTEDIDSLLGGSLTKRAEQSTQVLDKQKAEVDNAYLISAAAGDLKIGSLTIKASGELIKEGGEIINSAAKTFAIVSTDLLKMTGLLKGKAGENTVLTE